MASGFSSCHPDQVARLKALGLGSDTVTQGVGQASASAGTHKAVGVKGGQPYGHCIDLSPSALPFQRPYFDALVEQGFAPFPREVWPSGGAHWHLVDLTRPLADSGNQSDGTGPDHLERVNHQLAEWVSGGDGLIGDAPMPAKWKPTQEQRNFARIVWKAGRLPSDQEPDNHVKIVGLDGIARPVGWLSEDGISYAPVRAVIEACGRKLEWDAATQTVMVKEA